MNFEQSEAKFKELQARVQRGEAISRAQYEEQVSSLAVQDDHGNLWEINPRSGKWMRFDGASWVVDTPPGRGAPAPSAPEPATTQTAKPQPMMTTPTPKSTAPQASIPPAQLRQQPTSKPPARNVGATNRPEPRKTAGSKPPADESPKSGSRREWIPLAIGAVVLFACAVFVLLGYNFIAPIVFKATATPTRAVAILPTAVPTIVRLPSPTPLPPTPIPVAAVAKENNVNVRSSPSTAASKAATLRKDQAVTLVGRTAPLRASDGKSYTWYQINLVGATAPGWVREDVVTITSGDPNTLPQAGPAPTPTATPRVQAPPAGPQPTATLTPIGVIPKP
jgi:hypothetical protein